MLRVEVVLVIDFTKECVFSHLLDKCALPYDDSSLCRDLT